MSNLTNFSFNSAAVRTFEDKGCPWFSAKDVCNILGYKNDSDAIAKHCKSRGVAKRDTPTTSGVQALSFIDEGNLYRLIVKSRKPEAEKFEAWVMEEVLPSIRKTGGYTVRPHQGLSADEADMLRRVLTQHAESLPKDAQAAFIIKGWAKLKSHFGCSYRDIPSDKFTEALSLLGRHTLEHRPEPANLGLPKEWIEVCKEAQTMPATARRSLMMYMAGFCNAVKDGAG
jgi:prophage antirepressor-like protein